MLEADVSRPVVARIGVSSVHQRTRPMLLRGPHPLAHWHYAIACGCGTTNTAFSGTGQRPGDSVTSTPDPDSPAIGEIIPLPADMSTQNSSGNLISLIHTADPPLISQREAIEVVAERFPWVLAASMRGSRSVYRDGTDWERLVALAPMDGGLETATYPCRTVRYSIISKADRCGCSPMGMCRVSWEAKRYMVLHHQSITTTYMR